MKGRLAVGGWCVRFDVGTFGVRRRPEGPWEHRPGFSLGLQV